MSSSSCCPSWQPSAPPPVTVPARVPSRRAPSPLPSPPPPPASPRRAVPLRISFAPGLPDARPFSPVGAVISSPPLPPPSASRRAASPAPPPAALQEDDAAALEAAVAAAALRSPSSRGEPVHLAARSASRILKRGVSPAAAAPPEPEPGTAWVLRSPASQPLGGSTERDVSAPPPVWSASKGPLLASRSDIVSPASALVTAASSTRSPLSASASPAAAPSRGSASRTPSAVADDVVAAPSARGSMSARTPSSFPEVQQRIACLSADGEDLSGVLYGPRDTSGLRIPPRVRLSLPASSVITGASGGASFGGGEMVGGEEKQVEFDHTPLRTRPSASLPRSAASSRRALSSSSKRNTSTPASASASAAVAANAAAEAAVATLKERVLAALDVPSSSASAAAVAASIRARAAPLPALPSTRHVTRWQPSHRTVSTRMSAFPSASSGAPLPSALHPLATSTRPYALAMHEARLVKKRGAVGTAAPPSSASAAPPPPGGSSSSVPFDAYVAPRQDLPIDIDALAKEIGLSRVAADAFAKILVTASGRSIAPAAAPPLPSAAAAAAQGVVEGLKRAPSTREWRQVSARQWRAVEPPAAAIIGEEPRAVAAPSEGDKVEAAAVPEAPAFVGEASPAPGQKVGPSPGVPVDMGVEQMTLQLSE